MRIEGGDGDVPDVAATRDRVLDELVTFVRVLRRSGVDVPANASVVAARALVEAGFEERERVRAALRAALVSRREDTDEFERLFPEFWRRLTGAEEPEMALPGQEDAPGGGIPLFDEPSRSDGDPPSGDDEPEPEGAPGRTESAGARISSSRAGPDDGTEDAATAVYSPTGRPEPVGVSPAALSGDDLEAPFRALTDAIAGLRGRRWTRAGDRRADIRRALRRSVNTGGAVVSVPERERKRTAVRALLLVDVSKSVLDTIDRGFLIRFLRRARAEWRGARIFLFDTSVQEVTEAFDAPTPERALEALGRVEAEWGGGTRIGNAVRTVREEAPDAVDRETIVFVISDGLEVGEVDVLESGMSWLSRRADAVLWLNPLAASPEYEPACRGMAASLPYVDGLFAFAGPDDVAEIARQLRQHGVGGRIGYEHDPRRFA